jgi:hypothetical protein
LSIVKSCNVVSVSWGDHLTFGEGDGRLANLEAVRRRMERWRVDLGASVVYWRLHRSHLQGRFYVGRGYRHPSQTRVGWDDLTLVPQLAREFELKTYLYVSLFDEGWPLAPNRVRQVSYHNAMHGQHVSWQTAFSRKHPEYAMADRTGQRHQWGVLCLAYPEVRSHFCERFLNLLDGHNFDGLFLCIRSQSRPADFADQYGFNEPIRTEYTRRYERDICTQDFNLQSWRDLCGDYLTLFLHELKQALRAREIRLAVVVARGDVLGPPLGNTTLNWRKWVVSGIIDELVINQNSSQCPSMWHLLWPMHRGYGYLQNYIDGFNLLPLDQQIENVYAPIIENQPTRLYVARQWDERDSGVERRLLAPSAVSGLVFSSFRHDNPGPIARGNWQV